MQLAQLNIAQSAYPMDDPRMESFTGRIDAINALSDRSEGFIWRLTDGDAEVDGALSLRLPDDDKTLVNMSVWASIEALYAFIYKTAHAKVMQDNRAKFTPLKSNHYVLWWIEDGHIPDLTEAKSRLDDLRANGASPNAFTFKSPFTSGGNPLTSLFPQKDIA
ncbi:MAG: DUF3291 domain-containing protein [Maricaulaceae bacterium]